MSPAMVAAPALAVALLFLAAFLRERHRRIGAEARAAAADLFGIDALDRATTAEAEVATIRTNRSEAGKKAWATRKERKAAL